VPLLVVAAVLAASANDASLALVYAYMCTHTVDSLNQIKWERRYEDWPYSVPSFSLDGTDCHLNKVNQRRQSHMNVSFFSFKHQHDALRYWVCLHVHKPIIVAAGGGWPAGRYVDVEIARRDVVPMMSPDERGLADGGYQETDVPHFMTPIDNRMRSLRQRLPLSDIEAYNLAHKAVRSRHEHINAELKEWEVLNALFRHHPQMHATCFLAVAQLTQLRLMVRPSILAPPRLIPVVDDSGKLVVLELE